MSRTIEAIMRHMAPPAGRATDPRNGVKKLEKEITVKKRHYIWAESRFVPAMLPSTNSSLSDALNPAVFVMLREVATTL